MMSNSYMRHTFLKRLTAALGALLLVACTLAAQTPTPNPAPVVVELFTSEGCSSCPPADTLLRTLDATQPISGIQLIVLGEHVDYWDNLGWKDSFSSHAFTDRQGAYADRLHLASSYTPQMVVDGTYECLGSDSRRAAQTFDKARALPKIGVRISAVKIENGSLRAHVETDASPSKGDVFIALVLDHAESQVLRGENGGHRLQHVAVVRSLTKVGKTAKGEAFSKDVSLTAAPSEVPYRLVTFVQEPNQGKILGATVENVGK